MRKTEILKYAKTQIKGFYKNMIKHFTSLPCNMSSAADLFLFYLSSIV